MTLRAFASLTESSLLSGKKKEIDTMTMSKPFAKVAFAVLITIILILALYTSVLGANTGTRIGQSHVDAGLMADLSRSRSAGVAQLSSFEAQLDTYKQDGGHGCESEHSNPSDY
jgi:hypothetical protein